MGTTMSQLPHDVSESMQELKSTVSVIVPVFNECGTVAETMRRLLVLPEQYRIVVVDDGSCDGSSQLLEIYGRTENVLLLRHSRNLGKGAAIRTALSHVDGDAVIIQDADLEYDSSEIPLVVTPILAGEADAVFGVRDCKLQSRLQFTANRFLTWLCNMVTQSKMSDVETCYKAFSREVCCLLHESLNEDGFGVEIELAVKIDSIPGMRLKEVCVSYLPRCHAAGKKITWRDGCWAVWCVLRYGVLEKVFSIRTGIHSIANSSDSN